VGVRVAGNQSTVGVGVSVWVAVSVGVIVGSGGRISQPGKTIIAARIKIASMGVLRWASDVFIGI